MQTYPATFPCVQINGYRLDAAMGAARSEIPMSQVQRRIFNTMPHVIALSFVMTVPEWGAWQAWIKNNAYDWFTISLPSFYAGKSGSRMSPHVIRFTSPVVASNVTDAHVQVSVNAEMSPSMIKQYLDAVS